MHPIRSAKDRFVYADLKANASDSPCFYGAIRITGGRQVVFDQLRALHPKEIVIRNHGCAQRAGCGAPDTDAFEIVVHGEGRIQQHLSTAQTLIRQIKTAQAAAETDGDELALQHI